MQCDLNKIKEILLEIKLTGIGVISPQEATQYVACLENFQSDDKVLMHEIQEILFQLRGQAKLQFNDYQDHQKRQEIVDLILHLDKNTREIFIQNGLDAVVLVSDHQMRNYLEKIQMILESMEKKPNLNEITNMFKTPDPFDS